MKVRPEQVTALKGLSVLGPRETDTLCRELVRITERSGTPGQLEGDNARFAEIVTSMLSKETQERLLADLQRMTKQ